MTYAIELDRVVKDFGSKRAVDTVSLTVAEGVIFGLIGPNGAGKTTTFSMLAGYLEPSEGAARVLGVSPRDVGALKGKLGVLPQDALLPASETVEQFLSYLARMQGISAADTPKAVRDVLAQVGGDDWLAQRCGKLSHGMAKRVGIAQALLGGPKVVLLDEPTAGLDPRVAYGVRQVIKGLRGVCTVVVSSHNLQELEEVCDQAAVLDRGKLIANGTMTELTSSTREFTVQLAPSSSSSPPAYVQIVSGQPGVATVTLDEASGRLVVVLDPTSDPDDVSSAVLRVLLERGARVRELTRGRSLEQRVMELT
ncbi:MAG: ABC transporter ATP-binding protein [Deltaproteobacteria bacterium]|nr:ABC transporter ATP-binding protein [Deltaproteobacteria bacterium]